jgi:hypothetical protein
VNSCTCNAPSTRNPKAVIGLRSAISARDWIKRRRLAWAEAEARHAQAARPSFSRGGVANNTLCGSVYLASFWAVVVCVRFFAHQSMRLDSAPGILHRHPKPVHSKPQPREHGRSAVSPPDWLPSDQKTLCGCGPGSPSRGLTSTRLPSSATARAQEHVGRVRQALADLSVASVFSRLLHSPEYNRSFTTDIPAIAPGTRCRTVVPHTSRSSAPLVRRRHLLQSFGSPAARSIAVNTEQQREAATAEPLDLADPRKLQQRQVQQARG